MSRAYAEPEGQDQPEHPRSVIKAFAVHIQNILECFNRK